MTNLNEGVYVKVEAWNYLTARITKLEAALTLLTNGFKYSTEVVTIARNALGIEITRTSSETKGEQT